MAFSSSSRMALLLVFCALAVRALPEDGAAQALDEIVALAPEGSLGDSAGFPGCVKASVRCAVCRS